MYEVWEKGEGNASKLKKQFMLITEIIALNPSATIHRDFFQPVSSWSLRLHQIFGLCFLPRAWCLPPPSLLGPTFSLLCKFLILTACCGEIHLSSGFVPAHPNSQAASAFTLKWLKRCIFEISIHLYATPFKGYSTFVHLSSNILFFFLSCVYLVFLIYAYFICILYSKHLDCIFYISALYLSLCCILVE